jgi:hypothetical protein
MAKIPDPSLGKNWLTAVLVCRGPRLPEVLDSIFYELNKMRGVYLPNYTIREHEPKRLLRVSLRVLTTPAKREKVQAFLYKHASWWNVEINIPGDRKEVAWIKPRERSKYWNRERCETLHALSMAAIFCMREGVPGPRLASWDLARRNYAHLFVNMLGLREGFRDIAGEEG